MGLLIEIGNQHVVNDYPVAIERSKPTWEESIPIVGGDTEATAQ